MQRRWAAIYLAFFLVMAASAYSVMAVAEEPAIDIEGDTFSEGDTLEADGTTYTFTEVADRSGAVEHNETVDQEQELANNTVIEYRDGEYNVTIESAEEPQSFTLTQEFDVEAILEGDDDVNNETFTGDDGEEQVVYRNGTTQLLSEYLPEPDSEEFSVGETIEHDGHTKSIEAVTAEAVTVTWQEELTQTTELSEGKQVTFGGTDYVFTFVDDNTVMLSTQIDEYEQTQENREFFDQRMSGLLYVIIFSLGSGFVLAASAFMPRRE